MITLPSTASLSFSPILSRHVIPAISSILIISKLREALDDIVAAADGNRDDDFQRYIGEDPYPSRASYMQGIARGARAELDVLADQIWRSGNG